MGKLFGTDGIRGIVGENLTVELAFHVGQAVAAVLTEEKGSKPTITIGKDTRISSDMLEAALTRDTTCADAIHRLASDEFTREDFDDPAVWSDMTSPRYLELQKTLNQLRTLNSTRYLYTAKLGEDGQPVYLIDGLDLGAEDFAYPGTRIEEEMAPYIQTALSGEAMYSHDVVDTTWGPIFTACYPVKDENGQVMGALCVEIAMDTTYQFLKRSSQTTVSVALTLSLIHI